MKFRKYISAPGLLEVIRSRFERVQDWRNPSRITYSLSDSLMASTAMFSLKFPSLLKFDTDSRRDDTRAHNLRSVYSLKGIPSDTQMRSIVDPLEPEEIHLGLKDVFAQLQQGKVLESYKYLDDCILVAADGTGLFSSGTIACDNCCTKESRNGNVTNYHQGFSLVVIHPEISSVLPICLETISKEDGSTKNDCEMNAAKRALEKLRREHPHLKIRLVLDGLFAKAPMIKLARELKLGFIVVAKQGDHRALFEHVEASKDIGDGESHRIVENQKGKEVQHDFYFCNDVPINDSNQDTLVNVLEYSQTKNGKATRWVWVTDLKLAKTNVWGLSRAGRARWRIENETYNVLKNHGYEFEHNFGHGYQNLCTNLYYIMMIAFLIDQVQELSCKVFAKLMSHAERRKYLWEQMRSVFRVIRCSNLRDFYQQVGRSYDSAFVLDTG